MFGSHGLHVEGEGSPVLILCEAKPSMLLPRMSVQVFQCVARIAVLDAA
jgi:hypothetical protein